MEKEDYLETIYELQQAKGYVRVSDIAENLKLKKPSVSQMFHRLQEDGYVIYQPYKPIQLTAKGRKIAKKIAKRHQVLEKFLSYLKIPRHIREQDIHGMEHCISDITLEKLEELTNSLTAKNKKDKT